MGKSGLMVVALALTAACSQGEEATPAPEPSFTPTTPEPASTIEPAPAAAIPGTVPAAYIGTWDWTAGPCNGQSELQLAIAPGRIEFYESVGTVRAVRQQDDGIAIDLAMEGEGEQWEETITWKLVEGGTLLETDHEDPSGEGPLRYKRCPAETAR